MTASKLTRAQVAEIRARLARGGETQRQIAADYPVCRGTIGNIAQGKSWVPRPLPVGCPVTVYANTLEARARRCRQPLATGAGFCAKHEADRVRLGGAA